MKISSTEQPPREAVLDIELDPVDVEPFLERAYRKVVARANIPGFRRGKAPRHIIEQRYGRDYLLSEAMDMLVPEVTSRAIEEAGLELGGMPDLTLQQMDPPKISAKVPLTPTVDLGDYRELRVPRDPVEVTQEQVDEVLERIRQEMAPWEPVDDQVGMGDLLNVTVKGTAGDDEIVNTERADYIPMVESRIPAPGFAEQVVGMRAQETRTFTIDVPEDYEHATIAGKQCRFEVMVHIVKRRSPAPLDDDFAKGVGAGYDSLGELVDKVRQDLIAQEEAAAHSRHAEEALQRLLDSASIELSPLIVDHEVRHMLENQEEAARTGRMTREQYQHYLAWMGKTREEILEVARPEAETRIKRSLILREMALREEIEVTDADLESEIEDIAANSNSPAEAIRRTFEVEDTLDSLRRMLLNRRALERLSRIANPSPDTGVATDDSGGAREDPEIEPAERS